MFEQSLSLAQLLAPLAFVVSAIYLLGPLLPLQRTWARAAIAFVVAVVAARYLEWRLFTTVFGASGEWYEVLWIWLCFAIECFALFDCLILYLMFLKTSDRSAEADLHEAGLRATNSEMLPTVDVYIPTYNEPLEVLEKTITGAICLDYPRLNVYVLDEGRRPWLKALCEAQGVGYLTRPDNSHAKAGNINHALTKTNGDFFLVFDADFIPQRKFLMRTMGFFADPRIAIVQVPHVFYNHDPMQASLALRKTLPDDQRFFFEAILPSRDAWNCAFCCGSNSVTRRSALKEIGDQLPTQSITEDMLLSLLLMRKGYVTRYLSEHLAYGLAPEGLEAFFVQRRRWARGATQIMFLPDGPLGAGLSLVQRLLFLPTHWLSQGLMFLMSIVAPIVFLWTGLLPAANVTAEAVMYYLVPMLLAIVGGIWVYAPKYYLPFAAQVVGTFQSFKILPTVLATIVRPFGHVFKVTPKGDDAQTTTFEKPIFLCSAGLLAATVLGLAVNTVPEWRIIDENGLIPVVGCWCAVNSVILFLVCMMSLQAPYRRGEERFSMREEVGLVTPQGMIVKGTISDISLSGLGAEIENMGSLKIGDVVRIFISEVGFVVGRIVRSGTTFVGVQFDLPASVERDLLIRKLFTANVSAATVVTTAWSATGAVLASVWTAQTKPAEMVRKRNVVNTEARLPAAALMVEPELRKQNLDQLSKQRKRIAA